MQLSLPNQFFEKIFWFYFDYVQIKRVSPPFATATRLIRLHHDPYNIVTTFMFHAKDNGVLIYAFLCRQYIFVYSSGCYIREGGSIAMTGRNTESTDPATAGYAII